MVAASPALAMAAGSVCNVPKATQPTSATAATPAAAAHAQACGRAGEARGARTVGSAARRAAKRRENPGAISPVARNESPITW